MRFRKQGRLTERVEEVENVDSVVDGALATVPVGSVFRVMATYLLTFLDDTFP